MQSTVWCDDDPRDAVDKGGDADTRPGGEQLCLLGDFACTAHLRRNLVRDEYPIDSSNHTGSEYIQQLRYIAVAGCGEKCLNEPKMMTIDSLIRFSAPVNTLACPAGELLGRSGRSVECSTNLFKWECEEVVQHERNTLNGREPLQDNHQREADGFSKDRLLVGTGSRGAHWSVV